MEQCIHRVPKATCSFCSPTEAMLRRKRKPLTNDDRTAHGAGAMTADEISTLGFISIKATRNHHSHDLLDGKTKFVHILGHPFLWLVELILERAPNIERIQVIPTMMRHYTNSKRKLCEPRGVEFVGGHVRPEMAWAGTENRSPYYDKQQQFFLRLEGEQLELWEELKAFGFDIAVIAGRYFCLDGEDFVPQRVLCDEFGIKGIHDLSAHVNAAFCYLDPNFEAAVAAKRLARVLHKRVRKYRLLLQSRSAMQRYIEKLGIKQLPKNMPLARLHVYEQLLIARSEGRISRLRQQQPDPAKSLIYRFDLDNEVDPQYHTLEETGVHLGDKTREWARQLEVIALEHLGIANESPLERPALPAGPARPPQQQHSTTRTRRKDRELEPEHASQRAKPESEEASSQPTDEGNSGTHGGTGSSGGTGGSSHSNDPSRDPSPAPDPMGADRSLYLTEGEAVRLYGLFGSGRQEGPHVLEAQGVLGPALFELLRGLDFVEVDQDGIWDLTKDLIDRTHIHVSKTDGPPPVRVRRHTPAQRIRERWQDRLGRALERHRAP